MISTIYKNTICLDKNSKKLVERTEVASTKIVSCKEEHVERVNYWKSKLTNKRIGLFAGTMLKYNKENYA